MVGPADIQTGRVDGWAVTYRISRPEWQGDVSRFSSPFLHGMAWHGMASPWCTAHYSWFLMMGGAGYLICGLVVSIICSLGYSILLEAWSEYDEQVVLQLWTSSTNYYLVIISKLIQFDTDQTFEHKPSSETCKVIVLWTKYTIEIWRASSTPTNKKPTNSFKSLQTRRIVISNRQVHSRKFSLSSPASSSGPPLYSVSPHCSCASKNSSVSELCLDDSSSWISPVTLSWILASSSSLWHPAR